MSIYAIQVLISNKIQFIVINYINLFDFDDKIEMKNRSTIQTLTFVQTNPDHLYMKLNMPGTCNHPQFRFEKIVSL